MFFYTVAMFLFILNCIRRWAGRKTAIMAMPVPQFPLLLLMMYYVMYCMCKEIVNKYLILSYLITKLNGIEMSLL